MTFPIYGKIIQMFQTTNQISYEHPNMSCATAIYIYIRHLDCSSHPHSTMSGRWSVQNIMQQERFYLDSRPKYPEKMVCRPWNSICLPIMSMIPSPYFFQQPLSMVWNMWFRPLYNHGFRGLFNMNGPWNFSLITPIIFSFCSSLSYEECHL